MLHLSVSFLHWRQSRSSTNWLVGGVTLGSCSLHVEVGKILKPNPQVLMACPSMCECVLYVRVNSGALKYRTMLCRECFIALMSRLAHYMTESAIAIWICVFVCGMCCKALSVVGRLEALYNCSPFSFSLKHLMSLVSRNLKHLYLLFQRNS